MRRAFSIFLILFFGLGPLSVFLDSEDANLPPCCRRHGTHHCAMTSMTRNAASSNMPMASAPLTCRDYPGLSALLAAPAPALMVAAANLPVPCEQAGAALANYAAPKATPTHILAGRGPPRTNLT
jgi:hypothetical protein